jgi:hypothetical protein
MIFQLPEVLEVGPEHPTVFVQFKDHNDYRAKYNLLVDYVRLVRVDDSALAFVPQPVDAQWEANEQQGVEDRMNARMTGGDGFGAGGAVGGSEYSGFGAAPAAVAWNALQSGMAYLFGQQQQQWQVDEDSDEDSDEEEFEYGDDYYQDEGDRFGDVEDDDP